MKYGSAFMLLFPEFQFIVAGFQLITLLGPMKIGVGTCDNKPIASKNSGRHRAVVRGRDEYAAGSGCYRTQSKLTAVGSSRITTGII